MSVFGPSGTGTHGRSGTARTDLREPDLPASPAASPRLDALNNANRESSGFLLTRLPGLAAATAIAASLAALALPARPLLVWNISASVPTGLYAIAVPAALRPGDHALIEPPPHLAKLLARRGYLPVGVPLVKRVAAIEGQLVCRRRGRISIDGAFIGTALAQDRRGRALPRWAGCRRLGRGEVFLMNPAAPASFDGRYFGALPSASLIGRAVPLWTDKASTDRPSMRGAPMTQPLLTTSARKENLP
mgnify:CR=1 FL=1